MGIGAPGKRVSIYIHGSGHRAGNLLWANDVSEYLRNTDVLLAERDDRGKPVTAVNTITSTINQVNKLMKDLKAAEKEVLKEQQEMEGRMKGSKQMSVFEEGLDIS